MFEIGFPELLLIAIVGLLVIGPERLPETLRTLGLWLGRMRRNFLSVKAEIEKEVGMDEVRRQLHNEAIMEEMKRIESEVKQTATATRASLEEGARTADVQSPQDAASRAPGIPAGTDAESAAGPGSASGTQLELDDLLQAQNGEPHTSKPAVPSADSTPPAQPLDERNHSDAVADPAPSDSSVVDAFDTPDDDRDHTDAGEATSARRESS